MELWLDTYSIETIQRAAKIGLLHGVTTNPSLAAASGRPLRDLLDDLLRVQEGPVAVQVIASGSQEMLSQAKALRAISPRLIIKVPVTAEGLACMYALARHTIPVMATAVFEPHQALLAFKAGASYLAPYVGRIRDQGKDPLHVLEQILQIKTRHNYSCKILGAGLRTTDDLSACATLGLCAATLPEKVFQPLLTPSEGLTKALADFERDWQHAPPSRIF